MEPTLLPLYTHTHTQTHTRAKVRMLAQIVVVVDIVHPCHHPRQEFFVGLAGRAGGPARSSWCLPSLCCSFPSLQSRHLCFGEKDDDTILGVSWREE